MVIVTRHKFSTREEEEEGDGGWKNANVYANYTYRPTDLRNNLPAMRKKVRKFTR